MQDKIETMKAEHSQQIHFHYHKLEIESQLQLNKITRDMKNKLDEIKTLHRHETEDIHPYYHQQNSHDHIDHLSAMTTTSNDHDHDGINHSYTSDNSGPSCWQPRVSQCTSKQAKRNVCFKCFIWTPSDHE